MAYFDRQYDVYVMLGDPTLQPPWVEPVWMRIVSAIDPLVRSARANAAVRSVQVKPGSGSPTNRTVSFGRIGWNPKGHKKWVHSHDGVSADREFWSVEMWAPSWNICERENRAPDTYFAINNEKTEPKEQVRFNPVVSLAVALDQSDPVVEQGRKSAENIAQIIGALLRVHRKRPWGYNFLDVGFTNSIMDTALYGGLFKPGLRHQRDIDHSIFEGEWCRF